MSSIIFSKILDSDINNIKPVVREALDLIPQFFPAAKKEDILDFRLIMSEAICNAIIHGNKSEIAKKVFVSAEIIEHNSIKLTIEDEGDGFNYGEIFSSMYSQDLYKEDGRGFMIIKSLSDSVEFLNNGRKIHICKTVVRDNV